MLIFLNCRCVMISFETLACFVVINISSLLSTVHLVFNLLGVRLSKSMLIMIAGLHCLNMRSVK